MEKNDKSAKGAQGVNFDVKAPSIEEVRRFLKVDLSTAIVLLEAVYKDQATCDALADFLHGRYMNHLHKKELDAQQELGFK